MKVKELIEKLSKFNQETRAVICDADTGYYLNIIQVAKYDDVISISGDYENVHTGAEDDEPRPRDYDTEAKDQRLKEELGE